MRAEDLPAPVVSHWIGLDTKLLANGITVFLSMSEMNESALTLSAFENRLRAG